ncbi:MAG: carboxypeptidase regulatory-like domain-containing protein [Bacteroidales bacterium]|nr:carboxypeptidase regulatory-like domain-containing protein [Bacteroidales bacterium]
MKKFVTFAVVLCSIFCLSAQNTTENLYDYPEAYVEISSVSPQQLLQLSRQFSVDKVVKNESLFDVRLWLGPRDYADFLNLGLSYSFWRNNLKYGELEMATTCEQMAGWDRYPTYSVYCAMMDSFQRRYPSLCRVDTVLAETPNHHSLLAAYIGSNMSGEATRPQFYLASSIHGDEQLGFVLSLRLIDYLLQHYSDDIQVQNIVNQIDVWICPIENPDGMYYRSDDVIGGWSWGGSGSQRSNANGFDLNRDFPLIGQPTKDSYEPETQAIMEFAARHHFTMSASLHGGSELLNFPWDTWTESQCSHADSDWWWLIGRAFADTCHKYASSTYFMDEYDGVTPGGDWYVITGSQQDYMNYYQRVRESTIEISDDKSPDGDELPEYWNSLKASFLHYIEACLNGITGMVADSITGEPLEAKVWVENHDVNNSDVYSHLPEGKYFRPIKSGLYDVTFSADGYQSKTVSVQVVDGCAQQLDVQLVPIGVGIGETSVPTFKIYPNPVGDCLNITYEKGMKSQFGTVYDASGRQLFLFDLPDGSVQLNVSCLAKGLYFVKIGEKIEKFVRL